MAQLLFLTNYKIKPETTFSCSFIAKISVICFLQGDVLRGKMCCSKLPLQSFPVVQESP